MMPLLKLVKWGSQGLLVSETANAPPKSLRWRLQRTRNNGRLPSASYYWSCDAAPALVCFLIQEPGLSGVKHG